MPQPLFCPNGDGTEAQIVERWTDEDDGHDWVKFRCSSGYEWERPSRLETIRFFGWGPFWRRLQDDGELDE